MGGGEMVRRNGRGREVVKREGGREGLVRV
jgi:hypothetical protein